jgi:hypothetical protein
MDRLLGAVNFFISRSIFAHCACPKAFLALPDSGLPIDRATCREADLFQEPPSCRTVNFRQRTAR